MKLPILPHARSATVEPLPPYARHNYVTQEWRSAEMGKCVNAVVRLNGHYAEHLANLVRQLSDPAPPSGSWSRPTLPAHYRAQPGRLRQLRDALLVDLQKPVVVTGAAAKVGVQGMGGIGKSVLAPGRSHATRTSAGLPRRHRLDPSSRTVSWVSSRKSATSESSGPATA